MVGDRVAAEDILMETFYKAFTNLSLYSFDYAFSTWLYTIAKNNTIDYIRNCKKNVLHNCKKDFINDDASSFLNDIAEDKKHEPDNIVIRQEEKEAVRDYVSMLKPHYRILVEKFYFEDKMCIRDSGVFAPALFTGAVGGTAFALMMNLIFNTSLNINNFTLVGMAGVMAGVIQTQMCIRDSLSIINNRI